MFVFLACSACFLFGHVVRALMSQPELCEHCAKTVRELEH